MRADLVAALLDFRSTFELCKAIAAGEAPKPTGTRGEKGKLEPVWSREEIRRFILRRHTITAGLGNVISTAPELD